MKKLQIQFSTGYNWKYNLTHPWEIPKHIYYEVRYFIQRGLYGYADSDTWSLDYYLSSWLPSAIRRLQGAHGHPCGLTQKKWEIILERIAEGFEAGIKIEENCLYKGKEFALLQRKEKYGLKLFTEYFHNLWD
jgi:hypothetical protein